MNPAIRMSLLALGASLLVTAAVIAYLLLTGALESPRTSPPPKAVLVAARALAAGAAVSREDLVWRDLRGAAAPPGALTDGPAAELALIGSSAKRRIEPGELMTRDLVARPDPGSALATTLNPGWRAVTVKAEATDVAAGLLRPNDRVDVLFLQTDGGAAPTLNLPFLNVGGAGGDWRSRMLLQDARVLAVNGNMEPKAGAKEGVLTGGSITLEVLPADADRLLASASAGRLGFMVRREGDAPVGARAATQTTPPAPRPATAAPRRAPARPQPRPASPAAPPPQALPPAIIVRAAPPNAA